MWKGRVVGLAVLIAGGHLGATHGGGLLERFTNMARAGVAHFELAIIGSGVAAEHRMTGNVPDDPEELGELACAIWGDDAGTSRPDPWGRQYQIELPVDGAVIVKSLGPNGLDDGLCGPAWSLDVAAEGPSDDVCHSVTLTTERPVYALLD